MTENSLRACEKCGRTYGHDGLPPWPTWKCRADRPSCAYFAAVKARQEKAEASE